MERKTKTGLAIAGALGIGTVLVIVVSRRAQAEEGYGYFSFGQPELSIEPWYQAPGWSVPKFACLVTNYNEQRVTRTLDLWFSLSVAGYPEYDRTDMVNRPGSTLTITLEPGESALFKYDGAAQEQPFLMQQMTKWTFWLEDDLGNKSAEKTVST